MPFYPSREQRTAIEAPLGPVLVIAGPGAGKTYCLIGRVHHVIRKRRLTPERICAVTFTNKAAEEIAMRLRSALDQVAEDITRGTLHSLCAGVLREYGEAIGLQRGFGIADENYQKLVLRHLGVNRKRWGQLLTLFGRRRLQAYKLTQTDEELFTGYIRELRARNVIDFDDIIASTERLFQTRFDIAQAVGDRWDYVLVDECQDLNRAQYAILRRLVRRHRNIFAVGDDEQSIFSWTGADPEVLRQFANDFDIAVPIVLSRNRRCSYQIFSTARRLLVKNPVLFEKGLTADRRSEFDVTAYAFDDDETETSWIISDLINAKRSVRHGWGAFAILYRRHRVGMELEKALVRCGVPCRLARGRSMQDDRVIAYVVASLRLMRFPADQFAMQGFAERLLPEHLFEEIRATAVGDRADFVATVRAFARSKPRNHPDTKKAWRLIYHIENLEAMYQSHTSLGALVNELLSQRVSRYRNVLEDRHQQLTDPLLDPDTVALSERLTALLEGAGAVWVEPMRGVDIALRGMLIAAGIRTAADSASGSPRLEDMVLTANDVDRLPLRLFKALQLLKSREFGDVFRDFVAFDLETTDRDPAACEIIELGAVRVRDGEIVDRFQSLVRAARPISSGARKIHGYSDADIANAPTLNQVWQAFREFVGSDVLVAHNGQSFDVPVLRRFAADLGGIDEFTFFDTLPLARSLYQESAKLEDLAHRFGIETGRAHHALDDAQTLALVFRALSEQKIARARKAAAVNLLDYLGLALAVSDRLVTAEATLLRDVARPFTLGRYTDCLEYYATERERLGATEAPTVDRVIDRLGGREVLDRVRAEIDPARRYPTAVARLQALIDASRADTLPKSIEQFLERVVLSTSDGADIDPNRVNLLTLHSTKGLEFAHVYVVGVEDYQLPGYYQLIDHREDEIEEARRLLYVGMTRARDRLVLTRVHRRRGRDAGGSQFLSEMGIEATAVVTPSSTAAQASGILRD